MPRPCVVETHDRGYIIRQKRFCGCHGLVPWRLTFPANAQAPISKSIKRETPRGEPVASRRVLQLLCSHARESSRHKAVASH